MSSPLVIATGFVDDNWHSMRLVAEGLAQGLAQLRGEYPRYSAPHLFSPRLGRPPRWYDRRLLYGGRLPDAELIHLCDQSYGDALFKARHRAKTIVATVHDLAFWHARSPVTAPFRRRIRDGLASADALVASSYATAREMSLELGLTATRIVALGVDIARFPHVGSPRVPGRLLMVGSSLERKGVDRSLRLLARLPAPFHLVKLGEPLTREQAELAASLGVSHRVTHPGAPTDGELAAAYAEASLLLFPSRYEGYGLPPIEARLTGTRALVSRATPVREFLEKDGGTVVFPFEAFDGNAPEEACTDAVSRFLSLPGGPLPLADREWFGWARAAREYCETWESARELREDLWRSA